MIVKKRAFLSIYIYIYIIKHKIGNNILSFAIFPSPLYHNNKNYDNNNNKFSITWRTKWSWKLLANDVAAYYIMDDNNNYKISMTWMIVYWNMMQPNDAENY